MITLKTLVDYCNDLLRVEHFQDYCPNGLQVEGRHSISKIVSGVTANQALIDAAIEAKADLLLVHHGYFLERRESVHYRHETTPPEVFACA